MIQTSQKEIKEVVRLLLDHTHQAVSYLFSDQNTFRNALIIDWSAENAEQYLQEKEEKEKRLFAEEMGDLEAAEFAHRWISYIQHTMLRQMIRLYTPDDVSDESFAEIFPGICMEINQEEEEERIQARCSEIAQIHQGERCTLDGDGMYESILKRAEASLNRADRRKKNKNMKKKQQITD